MVSSRELEKAPVWSFFCVITYRIYVNRNKCITSGLKIIKMLIDRLKYDIDDITEEGNNLICNIDEEEITFTISARDITYAVK